MEGSSKTSAGAASGLPEGPLVDILSHLPAKSVCRFNCVSKGWSELIADPAIRKKLCQAMQGLFVETAVFQNREVTRVSFSLINMTVRSVPFSFSFLTEMTGIRVFFFMDSCNGLVLLGHRWEPGHGSAGDYFVCNPTTKEWLGVPACGSREMLSHTYLAFDPAVSSHFHLVQFQMPDVDMKVVSLHVYSSETGTWSQNQLEGQIDGLNEQGPMQFVIPFEWLLEGQLDEQNEQGQLEGQMDEQNEKGQLETWKAKLLNKMSKGSWKAKFLNKMSKGRLKAKLFKLNKMSKGRLKAKLFKFLNKMSKDSWKAKLLNRMSKGSWTVGMISLS